ncbi:Yip1-like protein [Paenibacillus taihuensis]|uniref:Yip1-like protein n=1 Tax=Paenibacillus taihuensis TaxID=1156355 RepID=A0A3D9Q0W1_9BACL|nr:Yip1 family protein [Paenibacillus taihuensis]REE56449.1 Yip1-like protein [Paenibacillus taihuensis]
MNKRKQWLSLYTMFHPMKGYELVKWDRSGSFIESACILLALFLYIVSERQVTGFIFNGNNADDINVPVIFLVTIGTFLLWFVSNMAVCSFMDGEGKSREVWIASTYALIPYVLIGFIEIVLSNLFSIEASPFLLILRFAAIAWSILLLAVGMYTVHQYSLKQTLANLSLTVAGIAIITFLLILVYSLFQQVFVFLFTVYNEIMFRM